MLWDKRLFVNSRRYQVYYIINFNVTQFQPATGKQRSQHPEQDLLSADFEIENQKIGCWLCTRYNHWYEIWTVLFQNRRRCSFIRIRSALFPVTSPVKSAPPEAIFSILWSPQDNWRKKKRCAYFFRGKWHLPGSRSSSASCCLQNLTDFLPFHSGLKNSIQRSFRKMPGHWNNR